MALTPREIDRLLKGLEPSIRKAFLDAIEDIRSEAQIKVIVGHLERGDINAAVMAIQIRPEFFAPLDNAIAQAYYQGGVMALAGLPKLDNPDGGGRLVMRFNVRNPRAEEALRDHSSKLVVQIAEDQREAVRGAMTAGMEDGRNPRETALDIVGRVNRKTGKREGGLLGLTAGRYPDDPYSQQAYVRNARNELSDPDRMGDYFSRKRRDRRFDATVRKAMREGKPLPKKTVDKIAGRYADRLLKLRGDVIARTEGLWSFHAAQYEALQQTVERGAIEEWQVKRRWSSTGDGRTRDTHLLMHKQEVGLNEPFVTPMGHLMLFPGDTSFDAPPSETIQCRCVAETRINYLAGAR